MLIRVSNSLRLTLFPLPALALTAGLGTLPNPEGGDVPISFSDAPGFGDCSFFWRALSWLCTVKTVRRKIGEEQRLFAMLAERTTDVPSASLLAGRVAAASRLAGLRARRGPAGPEQRATIVPLPLLVIMAGALIGGLGFADTLKPACR